MFDGKGVGGGGGCLGSFVAEVVRPSHVDYKVWCSIPSSDRSQETQASFLFHIASLCNSQM